MTHDEMIAVILADKNGEDIESKNRHDDSLFALDKSPTWDFRMNNYRAKQQLKKIDMSVCIESGVDCSFNFVSDTWHIVTLKSILNDGKTFRDSNGDDWSDCRVRENHWIYNVWDKCPIPEGLKIEVKWKSGSSTTETLYYTWDWHHEDIVAIRVLGCAKGYAYD